MTIKWRTKDGFDIEPKQMATSHLLSTIHMIERNRMNNLISIGLLGMGDDKLDTDVVAYYAGWPEAYDALLDEAESRMLIRRGTKQKKLRGK